MSTSPIRAQENRISELEAALGPGILGQRIRRERLAQGRSVREVGTLSGVGSSSIVRLEQGDNMRPITIIRVCEALGLHLERLCQPSESNFVAIHRNGSGRWTELDDSAPLEKESLPTNPLLLLSSRLSDGKLLPTLMVINERTQPRSHPGEEFVYVLEGKIDIVVSGHTFSLSEGDSMEFWGMEPHEYAPVSGVANKILSLRVNP